MSARATRAADFGRVTVVMGGESAERAVSLDGGSQVLEALCASGVDAVGVDGVPALLDRVQAGRVDRVFNLLHGRGGEDGTLQGALASFGVPVTGSGVLGSALSMHKAMSKRVWKAAGLPTADFAVLRPGQDAAGAARAVGGYPLVVKPVSEGSSVGIGIVTEPGALPEAVREAFRHEHEIMLERFVPGGEYTVGLVQELELPVIHVVPARPFYDYAAKYEDPGTAYHCPSGLAAEAEATLARLARQAFELLACSGWGRVDFILDEQRGPMLLELNTTPGMTSHSLVPKAAAALGIDFSTLCWRILETSLEVPAP